MNRDLDELYPQTRAKVDAWLADCRAHGLDILITSTYRSFIEQERLYAQGRSAPGRVITHARAGQSYHNVRRAVDFVPLIGNKPDWNYDSRELSLAGQLGEKHGLRWGGYWHHPDRLHLEDEWCRECEIDVGPSNAIHFEESGKCKIHVG